MKNRKIFLIVVSMIILIMVSIFYYKKYYYDVIDEGLMNKTWYKYNSLNGYYDEIYFDTNFFSYKSYNNKNNLSCNKYTYDKKNKTLNFNCKNKFKINLVNKNNIVLNIDGKNQNFYDNINDSLYYEFEKYYKKNLSEYKQELNRVKDLTKINYTSLLEIMNNQEYSSLYIIGNKCTSIECVSVLSIMEKLLYEKNNIYYLDIDELTDEEIVNINKKMNKFNIDRDYYNGMYPKVLIVNNNQIIDEYDFKCNGLNCDKYLDKKY